jgi:hypothetical protein
MISDLLNAVLAVVTWPFRALARVLQALFGR